MNNNNDWQDRSDETTAELSLINAAQTGDLAAFNHLVAAHEHRIYNIAYRLLNDSEEAADVAQDVFIAAFRYLPEFKGGSLRAWLCRVTTNACYDRLRVRKRRPASSLEEIIDNEENNSGGLPDSAESPEAYTVRRELTRDIQVALQNLSPEQRSVTILFDIQGFSLDEVARVLDLPVGTVKSRLSRARAHLREFLLAYKKGTFSG